MIHSSQADREAIKRLEGLFEGFLSEDERISFQRCIDDGVAYRAYEGAGGFMGLAKVRNL